MGKKGAKSLFKQNEKTNTNKEKIKKEEITVNIEEVDTPNPEHSNIPVFGSETAPQQENEETKPESKEEKPKKKSIKEMSADDLRFYQRTGIIR